MIRNLILLIRYENQFKSKLIIVRSLMSQQRLGSDSSLDSDQIKLLEHVLVWALPFKRELGDVWSPRGNDFQVVVHSLVPEEQVLVTV